MNPLLTEPEAAALLALSPRTLRKARQAGHIRYVAISERGIRYRPEDCEAYIAARIREGQPCSTNRQSRRIGNMISSTKAGAFMARPDVNRVVQLRPTKPASATKR